MNDRAYNRECVARLIEWGERLLAEPPQPIQLTKNEAADKLINDLARFPHAFVLACIMDQQVKSEFAWLIPYKVSQELGNFEILALLELDSAEFTEIFVKNRLHRFPTRMAGFFFSAVQRIHELYNDDASNIWRGSPSSATLVRRFLGFKGAGIKIATMAANILVREFKIPVADKFCIDISPDVHVRRVFPRLGLMEPTATNEELIYLARELNPDYPGVFDLSVWMIGRNWCRPENPSCDECPLDPYCPKVGV